MNYTQWNDLCPLDRTANRVFFALTVALNHLLSIYAIVLSISFFIKMTTLKNNGTGIIQRWSCCCAIAGTIPILVQNCIQIVQSSQLNMRMVTDARLFTWTRPFTLAVQFLRNWTYVCAACIECYLCKGKVSHKILEWLRLTFYAQVVAILLFSGLFYYILVNWYPCRAIACTGDFDDLPILFVVPDRLVNFVGVSIVLMSTHLLPAFVLVIMKVVTVHYLLALPASDRGLDTRWSFVSTLIHTAVAVWGLAVGLLVGEMASPWVLVWAWASVAALADTVTVILLVGAANSEAALAHAAHSHLVHLERPAKDFRNILHAYLCFSLCDYCLHIKRMFVFRLYKQ